MAKRLRLSSPRSGSGSEQVFQFRLGDGVYAVPVSAVVEVVLVPELQPLDERPPHYVGMMSLRGEVLAVLDLQVRMGRAPSEYGIRDKLLVLEHEHRSFALLVHSTEGVVDCPPDAAQPSGIRTAKTSNCIQEILKIDEKLVMRLDLSQVLAAGEEAIPEAGRSRVTAKTAEERAILRKRADSLQLSLSPLENETQQPMAVAEISGELFAFDLRHVREFCDIGMIARVPCVPDFIVGNANVRGEVLTVIDIRRELNLPVQGRKPDGKVIVAQTDELTVGLRVDELLGVADFPVFADRQETDQGSRPADVKAVVPLKTDDENPQDEDEAPPDAEDSDAAIDNEDDESQEPFRMVSILDMPLLLQLNRWIVDEEVGHV